MSENNSSNDKELPLITFNSLYTVLREEKKNKTLTNLPEEFYESLKHFIEEKKKEIHKLKAQANAKEKLRKEMNIFKNSQKLSKELLSIRLTKVAHIALRNGIYGEEMLKKENLLAKEEEIFKKMEKLSEVAYTQIK